jgi:sugar phosphate isomerase/epimerase
MEGPAMARAWCGSAASLPTLESWSLSFWQGLGGADLASVADALREGFGMPASAISVYGNPLSGDEAGVETMSALESLVEAAPAFGAPLVASFAGRLPGTSVPDSLGAWKAAFGPLCERAAALGISIAFENCRFGDTWKTGRWNIAICPEAWELMFDALPGAPIGLEWEPSHQVLALADPLAQLEAWAGRVLHVHAKDARLDRGLLAERGILGPNRLGEECLAGKGDTDWGAVFSILSAAGYAGSIDVEIGATPGYRGEAAFEGIAIAREALLGARRPRPGP